MKLVELSKVMYMNICTFFDLYSFVILCSCWKSFHQKSKPVDQYAVSMWNILNL